MARKIRPIRIEGQLAYVPLTRGLEAVIDAADAQLVEGFNWYATNSKGGPYAVRKSHVVDGSPREAILMHRHLLGFPPEKVDHRNGNGLDNRRENLRAASNAENMQNSQLRSDNTSGFKGVAWARHTKRWAAKIQSNGRPVFLGYFSDPKDAHAAYCRAAKDLHGEFARTE